MRNLTEDAWDNTDAESVASNDSMDVSFEGDKVKLRRPGKYYKNQVTALMISEFLKYILILFDILSGSKATSVREDRNLSDVFLVDM